MISKTQLQKDSQGYTKKPMQCNNCANYTSDITEKKYPHITDTLKIEKNKRCAIGGFAVQSCASCNMYEKKV